MYDETNFPFFFPFKREYIYLWRLLFVSPLNTFDCSCSSLWSAILVEMTPARQVIFSDITANRLHGHITPNSHVSKWEPRVFPLLANWSMWDATTSECPAQGGGEQVWGRIPPCWAQAEIPAEVLQCLMLGSRTYGYLCDWPFLINLIFKLISVTT